MQQSISFLSLSFFMFVTLLTSGQSLDFLEFTKPVTYQFPAGILLDGEICDANYFNKSKTKLALNTTGTLTMAAISCNKDGAPTKKIAFQVAVKNERTNTMWIYTKAPVTELDIHEVMLKCEMGDRIIVMPAEQKYELSNNEMYIQAGC